MSVETILMHFFLVKPSLFSSILYFKCLHLFLTGTINVLTTISTPPWIPSGGVKFNSFLRQQLVILIQTSVVILKFLCVCVFQFYMHVSVGSTMAHW